MVAAWRTTVSSSDAHAGCMVGLSFGVAEEEREENKRGKTCTNTYDVRAFTDLAVLRLICRRRPCRIVAS